MDRRNALKAAVLVLGAAISATYTRTLVSGSALDGAPLVPALDAEQLQKVATIAELIIPQTDTPGAIAAGVPEFIHRIVAEWYDDNERATFMQGLSDVDDESRAQFGARFLELPTEQQTSVLRALEARTPHGGTERRYGPFFARMKELTVLGYYTSEIGANAELGYRPVPGTYDGRAHVADHR